MLRQENFVPATGKDFPGRRFPTVSLSPPSTRAFKVETDKKALDILSLVFGSFMAALLVMGMYRQQILEFEEALTAAGMPLVSGTGPASIFASYPLENQSLGYLFL
jgi:glycerol uptake facilitator-like aquaporin